MMYVVTMVGSKQWKGDLRGTKVLILSIYYHLAALILGLGALNNRRSLSVSLTAACVRIFRRFNCEDRLRVRIYWAASWGLRRVGLSAHRLPVLR